MTKKTKHIHCPTCGHLLGVECPSCPLCGSRGVRAGHDAKTKKQRYMCRKCRHMYRGPTPANPLAVAANTLAVSDEKKEDTTATPPGNSSPPA
jgi:hypothetical protein